MSYNCSVRFISEDIHLMWLVTYPQKTPVNISYNQNFLANVSSPDNGITSTVSRFVCRRYIESIVTLLVPTNYSSTTGILLNCSAVGLNSSAVIIDIISSGKNVVCCSVYSIDPNLH